MRASPEALFTFVADPSRRPEWLPELMSVDAPPGVAEVGTRFTGRSSLFLHDFLGESEVLEADAPRMLSEKVVIGARFTSTWTFEPAGGGTRVRHDIVIDFPAGLFGWIERRVLSWRLRRMQRASLAALERYVLG